MKLKKICSVVVAAALTFSLSVTPILADEVSDLKKQKKDTEEQVNSLQTQLNSLMTKISELENDLITTGEEISQTEEDLKAAQEEQEQQYQAMKRRIKYMYEAGTGSATVEKVLSSGNTIHAVKNNVSVCMCRIIMHRIDCFIALTKIFFHKFSDDLESSPRFHIFFLKRNDDVIPLPFICLSKLLLRCKHLVKCLFRLAVNPRYITHILRLVRIYNISNCRL